jgi:hypothetical protein
MTKPTARRIGRPPKPGHRIKTSIVIDAALWRRLKIHALETGTDVSTLLGRLAEHHLNQTTTPKGRRQA